MSAPVVHRFRTGIRLVAGLALLCAGIMGVLAWSYSDGRLQGWHDLWDLGLPALAFSAMVAGIGAVAALQRLVLDGPERSLLCANFDTWHRWRRVPVELIEQVHWLAAAKQRETMVDQLVVTWRPHTRGGELRKLVLLDDRLYRAFSDKPSPFFHAVVDFIRAHNGRAVLPPEFD